MSSIACPNCGKPLRPGAKFCGNCGATLPAGGAPRPASQLAPGEVACPHCGKPVRQGAKFCNNCGKTIESATDAGRTDIGRPGATVVSPPSPGAPRPTQSAEQLRPPVQAAAARPSRRGRWILPLLVLLIAGCAVFAVAGYFAANRFGFLGQMRSTASATSGGVITASLTLSPTAVIATSTATMTITPTLAASSTATFTPTTTFTPTLALPTVAITPTALAALPPTAPLPTVPTASVPPAPAAPVPAAQTVPFEDTFDGRLSDYWTTWGAPVPTIESGFGDRWVELKAEDPTAGGITSGRGYPVYNEPGIVFEFEAQLIPEFQNFSIVMDWDPLLVQRGPGYREPGVIRLVIRSGTVMLQTGINQGLDQASVDTSRMHVYRLQVTPTGGIDLFLDAEDLPICSIESIGLASTEGKLSFSGLGWLSRVKVSRGSDN